MAEQPHLIIALPEHAPLLVECAGDFRASAQIAFQGPDPDQVEQGVAAYGDASDAVREGWPNGYTREDFEGHARSALEAGQTIVALVCEPVDLAPIVQTWFDRIMGRVQSEDPVPTLLAIIDQTIREVYYVDGEPYFVQP